MAGIYVGTYAKYNAGNLAGRWLDPEDYSSKEEFLQACAELHKDEADPELMFQDFQGIPSGMVSESHVSEKLWDWLELDDDDRELLAAWADLGASSEPTIEEAREAFYGTYDSEQDFAETYAEDVGAVSADAQWPYTCIDWERATRELMMDFSSIEHNGKTYIFRP